MKIEEGNTTDFINEITVNIIERVTQDREKFIFETINDWLDTYQITISKRVLLRAIECFQLEHKEEFEMLQKQVQECD